MAKSRPTKSTKKSRKPARALTTAGTTVSTNPHTPLSQVTPLLAEAQSHLDLSSPDLALPIASHALTLLPTHLPTLELLAQIHLELSDPANAYTYLTTAAALDPTGVLSGPDKFLWLAQIAPEGGKQALDHYSTAVEILRVKTDAESKEKLVSALCAMAELYMSDLCMEVEAEELCERFVNEALLVDSGSIEALTTLASMRVSQERQEDAVAAVTRAWETWRAAGPEEVKNGFAGKVALSRIMVETGCLEIAVEAVEELQRVDERLPDLWYLGGWTLFLAGERQESRKREAWEAARGWLTKCMKVYREEGWEDEGIWEHTQELLKKIRGVVKGEEPEEGESEAEEDAMSEEEWESEDDEDAMMA